MPRVTEGGGSVRPIGEPSEGQPTPTSHPPAAPQPPQPGGVSATPFTSAVQARPLPTLWGTDKIVPFIIEKLATAKRAPANFSGGEVVSKGEIRAANQAAYEVLKGGTGNNAPNGTGAAPTAWTTGQTWVLNDVRSANGNAYQCSKAGLGGAVGTGPAGTGTNIVDNQAQWAYIGALQDSELGTYQVVNTADGLTWRFIQQLPYPLYFQQFVAALCEGEILGVLRMWWNKERLVCPSLDRPGKGLACFFGPDAANQTLAGTGPWDSSGYQHTALITLASFAAGGVPSGTQKEMPDIALETKGVLFGASSLDPPAADLVNDLLTHSRRGAGWPSSRVDATTVTGGGAASFRTYSDAAGLRFTYYLDRSKRAIDILQDILNCTLSDGYWSGGAYKIVPLADQPIASPVYGATAYVPANAAQYNLGPGDFLDPKMPVQISRRPDADCFNCYPIEFRDRSSDYATITVEDNDPTDLEIRPLKRAGTLALPVAFPDGTRPVMISRALAQRSLNIRNTYTWTSPSNFIGLEPTDIVTLTEPRIGLSLVPVRIVSLRENTNRSITYTAEDYPQGVAAPAAYTPQTNDGFRAHEFVTVGVVPSLVDGVSMGVKNGAIPDAGGTRGGAIDNAFPNPTSENLPPPGADLTQPEWIGRVNLGGGAADGDWVRSPGLGASLSIPLTVPALSGESYYCEAVIKAAVAGANKGGFLRLTALDKTNASLGSASSAENDTTTYTSPAASVALVMPAGTVRVKCELVNGSDASAQAYFDKIYFRRQLKVTAFTVEPWAATRYLAFCSVFVNSLGTAASYANSGQAFGFDPFTAPSLVQVGGEPAKRLRLRLSALPNGVSLNASKWACVAHRMIGGVAAPQSMSAQLNLKGWNTGTGDLDFWIGYDDWNGGIPTWAWPYAWASVDATNGSTWDVFFVHGSGPPLDVLRFF
jgi:hypothetical protein